MSNAIYTPEQIQVLLHPVFLQYQVKKAILFGSYAKGTAESQSDIDILVDSGLKGLAFFGLLEDVVTSLQKEVDLLDTSQIIPNSEINTIPWKQLYGMRNRIVHGYSGVDMRIVWDTIFLDLPQLQREIQQYLN